METSSLAANRGRRTWLELLQSPISRLLSLFDLPKSFLEDPTHTLYLSPDLEIVHCKKPFLHGCVSETERERERKREIESKQRLTLLEKEMKEGTLLPNQQGNERIITNYYTNLYAKNEIM